MGREIAGGQRPGRDHGQQRGGFPPLEKPGRRPAARQAKERHERLYHPGTHDEFSQSDGKQHDETVAQRERAKPQVRRAVSGLGPAARERQGEKHRERHDEAEDGFRVPQVFPRETPALAKIALTHRLAEADHVLPEKPAVHRQSGQHGNRQRQPGADGESGQTAQPPIRGHSDIPTMEEEQDREQIPENRCRGDRLGRRTGRRAANDGHPTPPGPRPVRCSARDRRAENGAHNRNPCWRRP